MDSLLSNIKDKVGRLGVVVVPNYNETMRGEALERFLKVAPDAIFEGWGHGHQLNA